MSCRYIVVVHGKLVVDYHCVVTTCRKEKAEWTCNVEFDIWQVSWVSQRKALGNLRRVVDAHLAMSFMGGSRHISLSWCERLPPVKIRRTTGESLSLEDWTGHVDVCRRSKSSCLRVFLPLVRTPPCPSTSHLSVSRITRAPQCSDCQWFEPHRPPTPLEDELDLLKIGPWRTL
jgi:hypothetical protein